MFDTDKTRSATPATRQDAEDALREAVSGTAANSDTPTVEIVSGDGNDVLHDTVVQDDEGQNVDGGAFQHDPFGQDEVSLLMTKAIDTAIAEAEPKGILPDNPEFGTILDRIFKEQNPDFPGTIGFIGAHKITDPMPDELREKIDALGGLGPIPSFDLDDEEGEAEFDAFLKTLKELTAPYQDKAPQLPDYGDLVYGSSKPASDISALLSSLKSPLPGATFVPGVGRPICRQCQEEQDAREFDLDRRGVLDDLIENQRALTETQGQLIEAQIRLVELAEEIYGA